MRVSARSLRSRRGFTLLEVMIASVAMAIIFMGLISSISGSFLATNMANRASEAQATARRMLEEASELSYGDMILLDGSSVLTAEGLAAKFQVFETAPGLVTLEVEICRPLSSISLSELAAMTMTDFRGLEVLQGSRIRFTTLSTGRMDKAEVTDRVAPLTQEELEREAEEQDEEDKVDD